MAEKRIILAIWSLITLSVWLAFGSVLVHSGKVITENGYQPTNYINQIVDDWSVQPFTDIMVTEDFLCPEGWSEVYERVWYGQDIACDCLQTTRYRCTTESFCHKMVIGDTCTKNQT